MLSMACRGRWFDHGCTGVETLHILPQGTVVEGQIIAVSVKCSTCLEEFRLNRVWKDRLDAHYARSYDFLNVLASIAIVVRRGSLQKINNFAELTGIGRGIEDTFSYRYLEAGGLRKKIVCAARTECMHALDVSLQYENGRTGDAPDLSFDGA